MVDSPYINRFLQPDTLIPDPTNPQAFNRYSYVGNNPVMRNDPTGHCEESDPACIASLASTSPYLQHLATPESNVTKPIDDDTPSEDEVKSLIQDALDHPENELYGIKAVEAIGKYLNTQLPDGNFWSFKNDLGLDRLGYNALYDNELFPGAEDALVYLSRELFERVHAKGVRQRAAKENAPVGVFAIRHSSKRYALWQSR